MTLLVAAFALVYFVWGSTYLAIQVAVNAFPPLLMMAMRCLAAGGLLCLWAGWRGAAIPPARMWLRASIAGALFFVVCHGGLAWAEQYVSSGLSALVMATIPLWMVLLEWTTSRRSRPAAGVGAGLLLGFVGASLLVAPGLAPQAIDPVAALVLLVGAMAWAAGSLYSARRPVSPSVPMMAGMQLLTGGGMLAAASLAAGETPRSVSTHEYWVAVAALFYLITFASIGAFSAYHWLLRNTTLARVSTYAYVNPLIALVLGWAIAGESIDALAVTAAALILAGVVLVVSSKTRVESNHSVTVTAPRQPVTSR